MALNLTKRSELTRRLTANEVDQNFTDIENAINNGSNAYQVIVCDVSQR